MDKILELREKLQSLPREIPHFIGDSLRANTHFIEDKNTEQLNAGIRGDGSEIQPPYKELTKKIKALKGQPIDRVTLKDTGDFHKGITAEVSDDSVTMFGKDEKTTILEQKYGVEIIGLTDKNIDEVKDEVLKPELIDKTKNYLDV